MKKFLVGLWGVIFLSVFSFGSDISVIRFIVVPEKTLEKGDENLTSLTIDCILEYLSENSLDYIDSKVYDETLKKIRRVFEEKTGQEVNFSQLLAIESGANVYIEVSTKMEEKLMKNLTTSYSQVPSVEVKQIYLRIVLSGYDASTGKALGKTIVSTNFPVAGNTIDRIEKTVSKLSREGFENLLKKIRKYLEKGQFVSIRVIGVRDLVYERDISRNIDCAPGVKIKKRKSMTENYIEYEVVIEGSVEEFIDSFKESMESLFPGRLSLTSSRNLIIVRIK